MNDYRYLKDCQGDRDRCMRIWQITDDDTRLVQNLCANERLCDKMEKLCDKLKKSKDYKCAVSCCHDDACNSADTGMNFSLYLVILCIAVGVIEALNFIWFHFIQPRRTDGRTKKKFWTWLFSGKAWQELTPSEIPMVESNWEVKLMRVKRELDESFLVRWLVYSTVGISALYILGINSTIKHDTCCSCKSASLNSHQFSVTLVWSSF